MKRSLRRNMKAVSPVIATIIIVSIAIVMSIAVAYWMLGLGAAFTRFEKLETTSAYATKAAAPNADGTFDFTINLKLKNTGSATATIDEVFFNAIPSTDAGVDITSLHDQTLEPGDENSYVIVYAGHSGMTLELLLRTVAGRDYPKVIILP